MRLCAALPKPMILCLILLMQLDSAIPTTSIKYLSNIWTQARLCTEKAQNNGQNWFINNKKRRQGQLARSTWTSLFYNKKEPSPTIPYKFSVSSISIIYQITGFNHPLAVIVRDFAQYFQLFFLYTIICFCIINIYLIVCEKKVNV